MSQYSKTKTQKGKHQMLCLLIWHLGLMMELSGQPHLISCFLWYVHITSLLGQLHFTFAAFLSRYFTITASQHPVVSIATQISLSQFHSQGFLAENRALLHTAWLQPLSENLKDVIMTQFSPVIFMFAKLIPDGQCWQVMLPV